MILPDHLAEEERSVFSIQRTLAHPNNPLIKRLWSVYHIFFVSTMPFCTKRRRKFSYPIYAPRRKNLWEKQSETFVFREKSLSFSRIFCYDNFV